MQVPSNWNELSIGDYQRAHQIITTEYEDELDRQIALLSAMSGLPEEKIWQLPGAEIKAAIETLAFLRTIESIPTKIPKWAWMANRLFRVQTDLRKLTAGQYIDLNSFIKTANGDIVPQLHNLMAVLTTPALSKYDGAKHEAMAKLIQRHMSIAAAYPVALFFCDSFKLYTANMQDYLSKELTTAKNLLNEVKADLKTATDGSSPSTISRRGIRQNGNSSSK